MITPQPTMPVVLPICSGGGTAGVDEGPKVVGAGVPVVAACVAAVAGGVPVVPVSVAETVTRAVAAACLDLSVGVGVRRRCEGVGVRAGFDRSTGWSAIRRGNIARNGRSPSEVRNLRKTRIGETMYGFMC
jgi:hypothetical protein